MKTSSPPILPKTVAQCARLLALLACAMPFWAGTVWAQASAPAASGPPVAPPARKFNDNGDALTAPDLSLYQGQLAEMQKLQRDNLELKLKLEQAQLKAQISASENHGQLPQEADASPYVVNLTGIGEMRQALITVPGYGQVTVRAGDTLPNQWKVVAIDDGGVVATMHAGPHAKRLRLPFHAGAAAPGRPA
jgi:type IV pilus biogenesis protein PilP